MREKLIELLYEKRESICDLCGARPDSGDRRIEAIADHLIAHGVTIKAGSCKGCKWENRKRPQRCNCCRRNKDMQDGYTPEPPKGEA